MMEKNRVDWTLFFRKLADIRRLDHSADANVRDLCLDRGLCDDWLTLYRQRLSKEVASDRDRREAMNRVNPKFICRNHLAQVAIEAAQNGNFTELQRLVEVLAHPYAEQPENEAYATLPPDWASTLEVSCSS